MKLALVITAACGVAAMVGGLIAVLPLAGPPATPGAALALPGLAVKFGSADRIELVHAGQALWLERRGQVWGLAQEGGYPVRPDAAAALTGGLMTLRLLRKADGAPEALDAGDPAATGPHGGTLVRVLAVSGTVLGAIVLGSGPGDYARLPGDTQVWTTSTHLDASADPDEWSGRELPPIDPATAQVDDAAGLEPEIIKAVLPGIRFVRVQAAPQVHAAPLRTIRLTLPDGTANLAIGQQAGTFLAAPVRHGAVGQPAGALRLRAAGHEPAHCGGRP